MVKLNRIGVLKAACFLGIFGVFMGLIFGIIMFIVMSVANTISSSLGGTGGIGSILLLNAWYVYILIIPLTFGIINFLCGLIFTPLMNLTLRIIKGIDLDMTE